MTENFYSVVFSATNGTRRETSQRVDTLKGVETLRLVVEHFEFEIKRERGALHRICGMLGTFFDTRLHGYYSGIRFEL